MSTPSRTSMANTIPKSPFHAASHCTSPIFKIIAGVEGDEYTVHSSLLEKSPVLKAVVNGKWEESSERLIRWEKWDSATVSMFVEWLYTGEYCCVYPIFVERPEMEAGTILAGTEPGGIFERIKQRKLVREAEAQAKEAEAQAKEAEAQAKEANKAKSQATDAVNNDLGGEFERDRERMLAKEARKRQRREAKAKAEEAEAQAKEAEAQAKEAEAQAKEANKAKSQATNAVNNDPNAAEEYSESKTIIETPPASPKGGYNSPVVESAFYKEQMQSCANNLSDARGEKAIIKGRISELEQYISELEQLNQVRSVQVAEDLKRKLRASAKPAGDVSYARTELGKQMTLQRTLTSPLQELPSKPRFMMPDGTICTPQQSPLGAPWLRKLALIQGHEEFVSWSGFSEHPLHSLDFTPPFLAHATLYALGQYTQIPLLKANAFRALQVVLESVHPMSPHSLAARGFAKLVQYVYTHVSAGDPSRDPVAADPLRELVACFAAWNQTTLLLEQEYRWVLEGGGDFVLDLTGMLTQRLAKDG